MEETGVIQKNLGTIMATAIGLLIAGVQWLIGREIRRNDETLKDHEIRIRVLETDRVTKQDILHLNTRLNEMSARGEERHIELLDRINQ